MNNNFNKLKTIDFYQPEKGQGIKFGTDSLILGWYPNHENPQYIIDLGTGTGVIPVILNHRFSDAKIICIDILDYYLIYAKRNVREYADINKIAILNSDIKKTTFKHQFDIITANPPYYKKGTGHYSKNDNINISKFELSVQMNDYFLFADRYLSQDGIFCFTQKKHRQKEMFSLIKKYEFKLNNLIENPEIDNIITNITYYELTK